MLYPRLGSYAVMIASAFIVFLAMPNFSEPFGASNAIEFTFRLFIIIMFGFLACSGFVGALVSFAVEPAGVSGTFRTKNNMFGRLIESLSGKNAPASFCELSMFTTIFFVITLSVCALIGSVLYYSFANGDFTWEFISLVGSYFAFVCGTCGVLWILYKLCDKYPSVKTVIVLFSCAVLAYFIQHLYFSGFFTAGVHTGALIDLTKGTIALVLGLLVLDRSHRLIKKTSVYSRVCPVKK